MNTEESWEKEFDNEVDRLVARSLRDPSCKPLTELKNFVRTLRSQALEEGRENILKIISTLDFHYSAGVSVGMKKKVRREILGFLSKE